MVRFAYEEEEVVPVITGDLHGDGPQEDHDVVMVECDTNDETGLRQEPCHNLLPVTVAVGFPNDRHFCNETTDTNDNGHDNHYTCRMPIHYNYFISRDGDHDERYHNRNITTIIPSNDNHDIHDLHQHQHSGHIHNDLQNTRKKQYIKHCFLILIILLLQRYIPPPPPPNQSWNEFLSSSTDSAVSIIQHVMLLTTYISSGFVHNLYGDLKQNILPNLWNRNGNKGSKTRNTCSLSIRLPGADFNGKTGTGDKSNNHSSIAQGMEINNAYNQESLIDYFTTFIAGQDHAITFLVGKLMEWNSQRENDMENESQRPLSLLLSGPLGVGKYETAKQLAKLLLNQCKESLNNINQSLLTLHGMDYALDNYIDENSRDNGIVYKILDFIHQSQGSGAVIIIKHIENISASQRDELFRLWSKSIVNFEASSLNDVMNHHGQYNRWSNSMYNDSGLDGKKPIRISLKNVAFIATTDIGVNKLFEVLLQSDGIHDSSSYNDINIAVRKEIQEYFDNPVS